jgi:hypothetical protein
MLLGAAPHPVSVIITSIGFGVGTADGVAGDDVRFVGAATDAQLARASMAVRAAIDLIMGSPFRPKTIERRKTFISALTERRSCGYGSPATQHHMGGSRCPIPQGRSSARRASGVEASLSRTRS